MNQIRTHGVPPTHVAPFVAKGIVLIEEMVLAFVVDQSIGIIHPVLGWGEMELRPVRLVVRRRRFC